MAAANELVIASGGKSGLEEYSNRLRACMLALRFFISLLDILSAQEARS